jgi:hypothetical protein
MKPKPTKIQPGATHWNPNAGPDWYAKDFGRWVYFDAEEGNWGRGVWRLSERLSDRVVVSDLIPVEELMAQEIDGPVSDDGPQPPEWNGEGLPPVGTVCRLTIGEWVHRNARITYTGNGVFCYEVSGTEYTGSVRDANFRPIKSEREKAIDDIKSLITKSCGLTEHRIQIIATALFDAGYRKVEK